MSERGGEGSAVLSEDGRTAPRGQGSTLGSRVGGLEAIYGACRVSGAVALRERASVAPQQWLQVEHQQHCPTCREHPEGAPWGALAGAGARPG